MKESVWDYPRPPRLEPTERLLQVVVNDVIIADTTRAYRVLETSHPPVYYFPQEDIRMEHLHREPGATLCEWKGQAQYWSLEIGDRIIERAAWSYPKPAPGSEAIADFLAFYPAKMDACMVDGEKAEPQPGNFYGGWITSDLEGPFKGAPGTLHW